MSQPDLRPETREARIRELLEQLQLDEKVEMLSGHGFMEAIVADGMRYCARLYHIGAGNERLGIPPLLFNDGPRGIAMGASTCFPVSMARGASFDVDLERRVGDAIGRELRAYGGNLFGGVCINLLRHPAWGRAQETYGEDPFLLGEMGVALTEGVQHHNVVATVKHFAANSMENARFTVDVKVAERPLREVYLRHFERCIEAGAGAVMSAYNQVNGAYCGHNPDLLQDILKGDWGFDGFVYSDFVLGCRGADASAAGLDVEAPDTQHFGEKLRAAIDRGEVAIERIDDAVARVLRGLFRTLERKDPETYSLQQVASRAHVALAREAAAKSIVLLRNEAALPWEADGLERVLVLGELAATPNLGDRGSSRVYPDRCVTPLDGLRAALPGACEVLHDPGDDPRRAASQAAEADVVLIVAGYTHLDEGEFIPGQSVDLGGAGENIGGDRLDLGLPADQEALILAVAAANPRTVVAVMAGSAVWMENWRESVAGLLMLWYPGMEGGAALADLLLGRVNPSGRLPFTIPAQTEDLPYFNRDATEIEYDLWHGYTKFERDEIRPAYPFGFGLSYSSLVISDPEVSVESDVDRLHVYVSLMNEAGPDGDAVVQVYGGLAQQTDDEPRKRLCAFRRVSLAAGQGKRIAIEVQLRDLASFDPGARAWRLGSPSWRLHIGSSSASEDLLTVDVELPDREWPVSHVRADPS